MHFPCCKILTRSRGAAAHPAIRMARGCFFLTTCIELLFAGLAAQADSKSAAEFTLKTCTDAMADFAKVQAAARDNGWSMSPRPVSESLKKFVRGWSVWNVPQGDDTYMLVIYES